MPSDQLANTERLLMRMARFDPLEAEAVRLLLTVARNEMRWVDKSPSVKALLAFDASLGGDPQ